MKKKLFAFFVFTLILSLFAIPSLASDTQLITTLTGDNERGAYVVDMANLLSDNAEAALKEKLKGISDKHNCDIVVVTTNNIGNKTAEQFADDYFDYNGYRKDGILLLVSMGTRDWHISTTGRGIHAVTQDAFNKYKSDVVPKLSSGEYLTAFNRFGDLSDEFLTLYANGTPYEKEKEPVFKTKTAAIFAAISGLLTGGIGTSKMKGQLKSVHQKNNASDYVKNGSLNIVDSRETFLFSNVTRTEIQRDSSSGGGTHTSSSGTTHGGGGGKF